MAGNYIVKRNIHKLFLIVRLYLSLVAPMDSTAKSCASRLTSIHCFGHCEKKYTLHLHVLCAVLQSKFPPNQRLSAVDHCVCEFRKSRLKSHKTALWRERAHLHKFHESRFAVADRRKVPNFMLCMTVWNWQAKTSAYVIHNISFPLDFRSIFRSQKQTRNMYIYFFKCRLLLT